MRHDDHMEVASEYMRKADDQLKLAKELFDITRLANRALIYAVALWLDGAGLHATRVPTRRSSTVDHSLLPQSLRDCANVHANVKKKKA